MEKAASVAPDWDDPKFRVGPYLERAEELIKTAEARLKKKKLKEAEKYFRESLTPLREAFLLDNKNTARRKYLHEVGKRIHDIFGCVMEFRDGSYWANCPVGLSHMNMGFSIAASGKSICSICGQDSLDCPHLRGEKYDDVVACRIDGICNICTERYCDHLAGQVFNGVRAFSIMTKVLTLDHVALVENPGNPLCVVQGVSLGRKDMLERLPANEHHQFVYGKTIVFCHHCLECDGSINDDENSRPHV